MCRRYSRNNNKASLFQRHNETETHYRTELRAVRKREKKTDTGTNEEYYLLSNTFALAVGPPARPCICLWILMTRFRPAWAETPSIFVFPNRRTGPFPRLILFPNRLIRFKRHMSVPVKVSIIVNSGGAIFIPRLQSASSGLHTHTNTCRPNWIRQRWDENGALFSILWEQKETNAETSLHRPLFVHVARQSTLPTWMSSLIFVLVMILPKSFCEGAKIKGRAEAKHVKSVHVRWPDLIGDSIPRVRMCICYVRRNNFPSCILWGHARKIRRVTLAALASDINVCFRELGATRLQGCCRKAREHCV